MGRKFIGYVEYTGDDFGIFGSDAETTTRKVVQKSIDLAKKYPSLHYQILSDSPFGVVVFATEPFPLAEGEAWYEKFGNEEEVFIYELMNKWGEETDGPEGKQSIQDVLDEEIEEFVWEKEGVQLIFRYDRILAVSNLDAFRTFSIRTDKLFRWFFNE